MNKQIKEISLSAVFIAMAGLLSIIQLPIVPNLGLYLDFSFIILFISNRFISIKLTLIVSIVFPFFSLFGVSPSFPGIIFLIFQSIVFSIFDYILIVIPNKINKKSLKFNLISSIFVIFIVTIFSVFINVFLIAPWFIGFENYYWDFHQMILWMIISFIFNPIKLIFVYLISFPLFFLLKEIIIE